MRPLGQNKGTVGAAQSGRPILPEPARADLPESFWYSVKRRLLGPPMVNEQLQQPASVKALALGVLSSDGISSAAYGTEEILIEMLPIVGLAAFTWSCR